MNLFKLIVSVAFALSLTGCASSRGGAHAGQSQTYSGSTANSGQCARTGSGQLCNKIVIVDNK